MLDGLSLDQVRAFIAAADEGSFSAAARKLGRVQSAVSDMVRGIEAQLGVELFDRGGRYPRLTDAGRVLLPNAREIVAGIDIMRARARGISAGLESELSAVIDVHFPIRMIADAARDFRRQFPGVPLRLYVEALGGTYQMLLDKRAMVGVVGSLQLLPQGISSEPMTGVPFVTVVAADHPLALHDGLVPKLQLGKHTQIVLTDRSNLSAGREFGVVSPYTWRVADLYAKKAFLMNGLGYGGMPRHVVEEELASGRLVELEVEDAPGNGFVFKISAAYRSDEPPGPAGRWLIERLKADDPPAD